jgi:hypothetical protein
MQDFSTRECGVQAPDRDLLGLNRTVLVSAVSRLEQFISRTEDEELMEVAISCRVKPVVDKHNSLE